MRFGNFDLKKIDFKFNSVLQVVESRIELFNRLGELEISEKSDLASLLERLTVSIYHFIVFLIYVSEEKKDIELII